MTTPQSNPDEPNPPTNTSSTVPITHRPIPSWSPFKKGFIGITITLAPASIQATGQNGQQVSAEQFPKGAEWSTSSQWNLTFERGIKVANPSFARIGAAIENLQPDKKKDGNSWIILKAFRPDGSVRYFQTSCGEPGVYIVEIGQNQGVDRTLTSLLKAGRKEPAGKVVEESQNGLFKTYENECLSTEEVITIAGYFFKEQECYPNLQWRSIREDVEAFHQKSRKQPANQDNGQES